jgi:hypothetical protein
MSLPESLRFAASVPPPKLCFGSAYAWGAAG